MSEVYSELPFMEKELISKTHAVLKHEIKTGVIAQIRILEYIFRTLKTNTDADLLNLLELSYKTSIMQYLSITKEIRYLEDINLDNDLCLT